MSDHLKTTITILTRALIQLTEATLEEAPVAAAPGWDIENEILRLEDRLCSLIHLAAGHDVSVTHEVLCIGSLRVLDALRASNASLEAVKEGALRDTVAGLTLGGPAYADRLIDITGETTAPDLLRALVDMLKTRPEKAAAYRGTALRLAAVAPIAQTGMSGTIWSDISECYDRFPELTAEMIAAQAAVAPDEIQHAVDIAAQGTKKLKTVAFAAMGHVPSSGIPAGSGSRHAQALYSHLETAHGRLRVMRKFAPGMIAPGKLQSAVDLYINTLHGMAKPS